MNGTEIRLLNATSTGERPTFQSAPDDLEFLDGLPKTLRRQVCANNTKMSAAWATDQLSRAMGCGKFPSIEAAVASVCRKTALTEGFEITVFAGQYKAEHGCDLPHTAAGATVQQYGAYGLSRHPPRRYGKPVYRRQTKRRRFRSYVPAVIDVVA